MLAPLLGLVNWMKCDYGGASSYALSAYSRLLDMATSSRNDEMGLL